MHFIGLKIKLTFYAENTIAGLWYHLWIFIDQLPKQELFNELDFSD